MMIASHCLLGLSCTAMILCMYSSFLYGFFSMGPWLCLLYFLLPYSIFRCDLGEFLAYSIGWSVLELFDNGEFWQVVYNWLVFVSIFRWCHSAILVNALDCGIVVSKFKLQSCYYVHFWANTPGKGMKPSYPPSYGLNSTTTVLLEGWI